MMNTTPKLSEPQRRAKQQVDAMQHRFNTNVSAAAREGAQRAIREVIQPVHAETPEERYAKAFELYLRRGAAARELEYRDTGELNGGGYLAPQAFGDAVLTQASYSNAILGHAQIWRSDNGAAGRYPMLLDASTASTTIADASAIGPSTPPMGDTNDLVFGSVSFGPTPVYAFPNILRVSRALVQDSAYPVQQKLLEAFAERVRRALDRDFMATLLAGITQTQTTASTGAIDWNSLAAAYYTIDPAYRQSAVWIFSTSAMLAIRQLKDASNRPLLIDTPVVIDAPAGESPVTTQTVSAPLLFGSRCYESRNLSAMGNGNVVGVFADLSRALVVREAERPVVVRLDERFADYAEIGFNGFARYDALMGLTSAAVAVQIHA